MNAGDGSWWTGRLWRDRRAIGLFPSNFVELLPDTFRPTSRSISPLTSSNTPSPKNTPQKSKTFRKPFEAYAKAPHYTTAKIPETYKEGTPRSRENSGQSFKPRDSIDAVPSPPQSQGYGSRAPSPNPYANQSYRPSLEAPDSPPPPAPPPHRHVAARHGSAASFDNRMPEHLSRHNSNASYDPRVSQQISRHASDVSYDPRENGYHTPLRIHSPAPPSPGGIDGLTPSPLREAMDDVMEQLDALGVAPRRSDSPEPPPLDPWSPESFDMVSQRSKRRHEPLRPQTSMGIAEQIDEGYETYSGSGISSHNQGFKAYKRDPEPAQLSNYVERMESRLRDLQPAHSGYEEDDGYVPTPPPKSQHTYERPKSSVDMRAPPEQPRLRHKKSAYEVGRQVLGRTLTSKTSTTNSSSATQSTNRSLMSGVSAGGISATSAGSLARKNQARAQSAMGMREFDEDRPETPFTGVTYHSSHASGESRSKSQAGFHDDALGGIGGLVQPKAKKQNFIKRILDSARTGVASSRGSIATAGAGSIQTSSPASRPPPLGGMAAISGGPLAGMHEGDAAREMGLGNGVDWVQVRRDVNRSNSLSRNERAERKDRCQMLDCPAIDPVDELYDSIDGDEGADGMPVAEPTNYQAINLSQVDKNSRFIVSLPPLTNAITLATTYVCRPYRSDVQRLRAIFTWVSEKICWEEDFEGEIDSRRAIQGKRGCAEEYAVLVLEMCLAVGLHCEIVRGYLKTPGEIPDNGIMPRSNHWWNAVLVDNEWRMIDCCLASPSNPRRGLYSNMGSGSADPWWFLTRPTEICYTHIPEHHEQQHICSPVAHEILLNLPCSCPPYFKNGLQIVDYNTSLTRIEDLEMVHVKFIVPADIEVAAEVEVRAFSRDSDGDFFESGDVVKKRALAQAEWFGGVKRYTVKGLLPGDEGTGILKVYAGKRGLMHSIKDIPHPMAFALPIIHTGENPPYEFVTRHPTPHAQRHDIYVVQPQCQRLALNNTFVFAIRQHPSSLGAGPMTPSSNPGGTSPIPFARPGSAMSMTSSSAAGSNPSSASGPAHKPAKLAIQTPGGKILRLMRKEERRGISVGGRTAGAGGDEEIGDGGTWETIIKCSERGVWRGLVLADRTARWCVFAEWVCVG